MNYLGRYFNVAVVSSNGPEMKEIAEREGVRTIGLDMEREIAPAKDLLSFIRLVWLMLKERPHIVCANTPKGSLLSLLAAKLTFVSHRIYIVTGLRFETEQGFKRKLLIFMEKLACWAATRVIPEGNGVKQTLYKNHITKKPLSVIGNGNINGIDLDYYQGEKVPLQVAARLREQYGIREGELVYCFVGRVVKEKGIQELVWAFDQMTKQMSGIRLLIIGPQESGGEGIDEDTFRVIEENSAITMTGFQSDVRSFLKISDILVLPSYREGFPNVVLQAGAMGLPCVVTNISGCNEIIRDGYNGFIVEKQDQHALFNALHKLAIDRSLITNMSGVARTSIAERFDQKVLWEEWLKMYKSLG